MVKVYSTPTCPWCKKVKDYLNSKNVPFTDVNVAEDADQRKEMMELSGQGGVPVINIYGHIVVGFNKEEIDRLIVAEKVH
ncbi:MAG: glutaredoxin domain-containing protein [Bacillota bacterium]|nr:glutaredoxin domain-containing protein [Bacillota bacterium]